MSETPPPDWLDVESAAPRKRTRKSKRQRAAKARKSKPIEVVSSVHIQREAARRFGPGRIWGCDGNLVFFRPKRMIDGVFTQVANPTAMERHEKFLRLGHYKYITTFDDVQVYEVTDLSPMKRKFGSLMEMTAGQVRRAVIMAAVKREWTLYCDALEELAVRIKGLDTGPLGANQWKEDLAYIEIQIAQRGGPTPQETGMNLQRVRMARQGGSERRIMVT